MKRALKWIGLVCVVITCLLSFVFSTSPGRIHEVNITIDSMAFVTDTSDLSVEEGDTIRLFIHNEDAGMTHAFEIEELNLRVNNIHYDEVVSADINVNDLPNQLNYTCRHHSLMAGTIFLTQ
tara:strand:+ start:139 stop:504 length:366 start_codon:yes stop_codon:yes gene_type:complete